MPLKDRRPKIGCIFVFIVAIIFSIFFMSCQSVLKAPTSQNIDNKSPDVSPMEVDSNMHEKEQPCSSVTPRRKSIPSMGKRRSITFPRDLTKNGPENNESSVFELLSESCGNNEPNFPNEKAMDEYNHRLERQITKFDRLMEIYSKKLADAQMRASMKYVLKSSNIGGTKVELPNFDIGKTRNQTPAEKVVKLLSDFRKLTPDPTSSQSTDTVAKLEEIRSQKKIKLLQIKMLEEVDKKYSAEKKLIEEKVKAEKEQAKLALDNVEKAEEFAQKLKLEFFCLPMMK